MILVMFEGKGVVELGAISLVIELHPVLSHQRFQHLHLDIDRYRRSRGGGTVAHNDPLGSI